MNEHQDANNDGNLKISHLANGINEMLVNQTDDLNNGNKSYSSDFNNAGSSHARKRTSVNHISNTNVYIARTSASSCNDEIMNQEDRKIPSRAPSSSSDTAQQVYVSSGNARSGVTRTAGKACGFVNYGNASSNSSLGITISATSGGKGSITSGSNEFYINANNSLATIATVGNSTTGNNHANNNRRRAKQNHFDMMSEEDCDRSQSSGGASWDEKKGRRSSFRSAGGSRFGRGYSPRWRDQENQDQRGITSDDNGSLTDDNTMGAMSYARKASSPGHDNVIDTAPVSDGAHHDDVHHHHDHGHAKDSEPDTASQTSQADSHHSSLVVHAHDSVADMSDDHRSLLGHPPSHEEGYGSANERSVVHHPMQDMSDSRSHSTAEGYQSAGALSDGEGRLDSSSANVAHHYPFHHPHKYASAFSSTRSVGSTGSAGGGSNGPPGKVMIAHGRMTPSHNNLSLHPIINSETRFPTNYAASEAAKSDIATVW